MKALTNSVLGLMVATAVFSSFSAEAKHYPRPNPSVPSAREGAPADDSDLVRAVRDKRNVNFVQAHKVVVSKVLTDDTNGLPHERWYVKLSDGSQVFAVYNIDLGKRIPIKVGDVMSLGGEFKWTNVGPLIHWLHYDPSGRRPDGFVEVNGVRYGGR